MKISTQKKKTKNLLIVISVVLLLGMGAVGAYRLYTFSTDSETSETPTTQSTEGNAKTEDGNGTSGGGTDDGSKPIDSTENNKDAVDVIIVDAGQYERTIEVRAYAADVSESGVCTFTFTQGSSSLVRTTTASPSAQTTSCAALDISTPEFPTLGTWNLVVSYSSSTSEGSSNSQDVELK